MRPLLACLCVVLLPACAPDDKSSGGEAGDTSATDTGGGSEGGSGSDSGGGSGGGSGGDSGSGSGGDTGGGPDGEWAVISGIYSSQYAEGVAVDDAGDVYFGGSFANGIDLGDGGFASYGGDDVLVGRLHGGDGTLDWNAAVRDEGSDVVYDVAVSPDGALYAAGWFEDDLEFPGHTLTSKGDYDGFLARWEADGTFAWVLHLGGSGDDRMRAVGADASGACVAGFSSNGITGTGLPLGGTSVLDGVVVCADSAGTATWGTVLGFGAGSAPALAIAVSDVGVTAGGYFTGELDVGAGRVASLGDRDAWVMSWPRAGGDGTGHAFGATGDQEVLGLAQVDGSTVAVGMWAGGDTPDGGIAVQGESDAFLVDVGGSSLGSVALFGGPGADEALDVDAHDSGALALVGFSTDTLTLAAEHAPLGDADIWAGIYDSGWTASGRFGGPGEDKGRSVAFHPSGDLIIGGTSYGSIDIGGVSLTGYGDRDFLLARVAL